MTGASKSGVVPPKSREERMPCRMMEEATRTDDNSFMREDWVRHGPSVPISLQRGESGSPLAAEKSKTDAKERKRIDPWRLIGASSAEVVALALALAPEDPPAVSVNGSPSRVSSGWMM